MNSFAMIFGHCVWISPSPKAVLAALRLFFGIGINDERDIVVGPHQPKTPTQAQKEVTALNSCFGTYEVPLGNRNHLENAGLTPPRNLQSPIGRWATSVVGAVQL
jgi:hypothetical protein